MSMQLPGLVGVPLPLVHFAAYVLAVQNAMAAFHPSSPRVVLAEHFGEMDASGPMLVIDIPSWDAADTQTGPGLDAIVNLEFVVGTDRGKSDAGAMDCYDLVEQTVALANENRWGLGAAVDPCRFVGASREGMGAVTDNWYAWRCSFRQAIRLPVPADLGDNLGLVIDASAIHEVWLGFDPDIGLAHIADYVLVAKVEPTP